VEIPASSVEYVSVPVQVPSGTTMDGARVALVSGWRGRPVEDDWKVARVGGSAVTVRYDGDRPRGTLGVWVEVTAGDEVVVRRAGSLRLT